jgi:CheY-like chemotaxis protein
VTTFTVQSDWPVLVLEDTPERIQWFRERLPQAVYCATADAAIEALKSQTFRVIFLDNDLHWMHADNTITKGTGKEVAMHIAKAEYPGIVVIHSRHDDAVEVMRRILPGARVARFGEFEIQQGQEG